MSTTSPIQWSIFTIDPEGTPGSKRRGRWPVLDVSRESANQTLPVVTVLPLSTRKSGRHVYPNEVLLPSGTAGLRNDAIAMAHQTRTLAKRRLRRPIGTIEDDDLKSEIRRAMRVQLNLDAT